MYSQVLQKSKPQVCFFLKTFLVIVAFLENATIGYSLESVCDSAPGKRGSYF